MDTLTILSRDVILLYLNMFKIQRNSYRCNAHRNHEFVKRNLVFVKHMFDSKLMWEPFRSLYGKPLYKTLLYKPLYIFVCVCMWWYILLFHDFSSGLLDFIIIYFYFLYGCGFSFFFQQSLPWYGYKISSSVRKKVNRSLWNVRPKRFPNQSITGQKIKRLSYQTVSMYRKENIIHVSTRRTYYGLINIKHHVLKCYEYMCIISVFLFFFSESIYVYDKIIAIM